MEVFALFCFLLTLFLFAIKRYKFISILFCIILSLAYGYVCVWSIVKIIFGITIERSDVLEISFIVIVVHIIPIQPTLTLFYLIKRAKLDCYVFYILILNLFGFVFALSVIDFTGFP